LEECYHHLKGRKYADQETYVELVPSHWLFNSALEYAIKKAQENQVGLKLNGTHQLLAYTDVNLLGDTKDTLKKNIETLIDASKEVGLEINVENTKYRLSRYQNVGH
jgi:hypothetical protein